MDRVADTHGEDHPATNVSQSRLNGFLTAQLRERDTCEAVTDDHEASFTAITRSRTPT